MRRRLLAAVAVLLVFAPAASASSSQESMFQDDNKLIYTDRAALRTTLDRLASLGVDRLRVTVLWKNIAPAPTERTRPAGFNASDPAAYPVGNWERYDVLVYEARARGLLVNFNITGPSPLWANKVPPRPDIAETYEPSAAEFAQFVIALGRRYDGNYPDSPYVPKEARIPRVDYWSIWNEPNHSGWLTPTWAADGKTFYERSASLYRELVDAAWAGLAASGHGTDTILVGETAPKGDRSKDVKRFMKPLIFIRALYCVDERLRPLGGARAGRLGCPGKRADFRAAHPGLFSATGWAHHPYELILAPNRRATDRDYVTLSSLKRLSRTLDTVFRRYGSKRHLPFFLTEYGYQTNPPDVLGGVSWAKQAAYLNQAEYMAYRNRRVRTLAQFLLVDDDIKVPASFQSGLMTQDGKTKPSMAAYRLPIWVTRRGRSRVSVWSLVRAAPNGAPVTVDVQYRPRGSKKWRRARRATSKNARNYLTTRVRARRGGLLRIAYTPPGATRPVYSRAARVR